MLRRKITDVSQARVLASALQAFHWLFIIEECLSTYGGCLQDLRPYLEGCHGRFDRVIASRRPSSLQDREGLIGTLLMDTPSASVFPVGSG